VRKRRRSVAATAAESEVSPKMTVVSVDGKVQQKVTNRLCVHVLENLKSPLDGAASMSTQLETRGNVHKPRYRHLV